jgi:hypothetical protein
MTDHLTPEAVKAALDGATPGNWRVDEPDHHPGMIEVVGPGISCRGFTIATDVSVNDAIRKGHDADLIAMAPALARDWLRLKKVEEAGEELADRAGKVECGWPHKPGWIREALAAFRAAVGDK